jgi:hypothetical protein
MFVGELIKDDNDDGENRPDITHPTSGVQIKLYTVQSNIKCDTNILSLISNAYIVAVILMSLTNS